MTGPTWVGMARVATLLALAVLAAGLASGCGGGSAGDRVATGEPISFEQLAQSAQASTDAESGRFSFSLDLTTPGADQEFAFSGEGAFDQASGRASMSLDLSSFAALLGGLFAGLGGDKAPSFDDPDAWRVEAVRDGDVTYVRFPAITDKLPAGKAWVRAEDGSSLTPDFDLSGLTQEDPREILEILRGAAGEVVTVGTESLRGVETTHYRVHIDPTRYGTTRSGDEQERFQSFVDRFLDQTGLGEIPVDVWMDADGLVRKMVLELSATQPGTEQTAKVSAAFELWDYGETVTIDLPPADQVADASALKG